MSTAQLDWDDMMGRRPSPYEFECSYCGEKIGPESIENWRTWVLFCLWERKNPPPADSKEGIETTV